MISPFKIAYILRHFPLPSETFVINEIIALQIQGCDIHPVSLFAPEKCQEGLMSKVQRKAHDLSALNVHDEARKSAFFSAAVADALSMELPDRYAWYAALVGDYITANNIDNLHAHFATESALVAMIASRLTGVPFTFTAHAYDIFIRQKGAVGGERLERRLGLLCENASRIVTISEFNKRHITSLTNRKFAPKIEVVHCGIDPERFSIAAREPSETVTFLCVGRFVEKKGCEYLLRAFAKASRVSGNLRLRLVGDGPLRPAMEALCRELGIEGVVDFLGSVPSEIVQEEMRKADVFVLHSVTAANGDREGIPVSLMEASATGLPVLSTRHSGIAELVADGVSGFLTEERDVAGFANCMIALAASRELRDRMGQAGAVLVTEHYNLHVECGKLKECFAQAVSKGADSPATALSTEPFESQGLAASVVICTYNRADLLGDSILAVQRQDFPVDRYEIIVVDNNSTDGTEGIVRELAASSPVRITYLFEGQQGLSYARNTGIRNAKGQIIAFVDDDIDAECSWLSSMVAAFEQPDVAAAGGPIRAVWLLPRPNWLSDRWQGHFTVSEFLHARESGEYMNPNYPWGANMAFRKDVFGITGMFPTDLGRVGKCLLSNEEIDLFRRIEANGKKIRFAPNAIIHHKIPAERMRKLWLYHRTYWQGRSNAVIDLNDGKYLYRNLLKNLSTLSWCATSTSESEFDRKCIEKAAFGYIYQVMTNDGGKGDFRRLRALKLLLRAHMDAAPSASNTTKSANKVIPETPYRFAQELLKQKDEQINALLNSLSWKITKPLRILYERLGKFFS